MRAVRGANIMRFMEHSVGGTVRRRAASCIRRRQITENVGCNPHQVRVAAYVLGDLSQRAVGEKGKSSSSRISADNLRK